METEKFPHIETLTSVSSTHQEQVSSETIAKPKTHTLTAGIPLDGVAYSPETSPEPNIPVIQSEVSTVNDRSEVLLNILGQSKSLESTTEDQENLAAQLWG